MNPLTYIVLFGSVVLGTLIVNIFKAQSGKRSEGHHFYTQKMVDIILGAGIVLLGMVL